MAETFLHGVEVLEIDAGPRPIQTVRSSVIGLIGTAPSADATAFPLNTPVLIAGSRREAAKLATARSIALAGDVTGSATFDGSANVSITATVANDSHSHSTSTITGLGTAATKNAQTSSTDTTAGALMAVGAFGLGASKAISSFEEALEPGFYHSDGSSVIGGPPGSSWYGLIATVGRYGTEGVRVQLCQHHSTADANRYWEGVRLTATGTLTWTELYHTGNISSIAIGVGQTWQDVTASRAKDTIYTNSTGRPIQLHITGDLNVATLTIGGVALNFQDYSGGSFINTIIPNNTTYSLTWSGSGPNLWAELR